ncbi:infection structure specific protein [Xylariales sp. AK1849]|nr:infection structure specific protein [Xylariales sp. AK1849]
MFTKTVAVAALVAVTSAQLPAVARRDFIEARQTASLDVACQSAIASVLPIYSELPSAPADLLTATLPSDPCETPSFTGSLSSEYSSYTSEVLVWYTSHSDELLSALASCTELSSYASQVPVCSSAASGASSVSASATTTSTSSASSGTATPSKNAAPRETGLVAAVVAAAGFIGAVAAL